MRVLIVRIGAMGDVLHAMPAVVALRAAHPDWFIGWAIEPRWSDLLQIAGDPEDLSQGIGFAARPLIDRWYRVAAGEWRKRPLAQTPRVPPNSRPFWAKMRRSPAYRRAANSLE